MTDTERGLQAALDADPADGLLRLMLADHLEEIGDERGPGYRMLGVLGKFPFQPMSESYWTWGDYAIPYPHGGRVDRSDLPGDWAALAAALARRSVTRTASGHMWFAVDSRREADDLAARAFARLTEVERAAVLAATGEGVRT